MPPQGQIRFPEAALRLMQLYEALGKKDEEATRFLTVAAALRPDSPGARFNLGIALALAGPLDEAIAACRRAIQ